MSQFGFLTPEWPDIYDATARAEALAISDPRACAFYTRRALELVVEWLYTYDKRLTKPYADTLHALLHAPGFRTAVGEMVFRKADFLKSLGNTAVHGAKAVSQGSAEAALSELFHVTFWLARTFARDAKPDDTLAFDRTRLPKPMAQIAQIAVAQLRAREAELHARDAELAAARAGLADLGAEVARLREQVAAALAASAARIDPHDYGEAETRTHLIDLLLREAGWDPQAPGVAEVPVTGLPTPSGQGRADYVLWGEDGKPLAVVEAKATRRSPLEGQEQGRRYADALEGMTGQRPVIYATNGYEHWLWDDSRHPPRPVAGFAKRDELALLVQRRTTRRALAAEVIDGQIVERPYQHRAIRRIGAAFEDEGERRALVVMATGTGKTRCVIALCDLLMRANWIKRVLFLADRKALVNQATRAFREHLPSAAPVNLLDDPSAEGRVHLSTYPTMMGLIDKVAAGQRRFGVAHYDLIVVDEAHRSIYQKYGAIFDYFDALLVGLTATPRDEIDRNTYRLFGLEDRMPTDVYPLDEAVRDGWLVPMHGLSVPLRIQREGLRYDQRTPEEQEEWEARLADEDGAVPDEVEPEAINRWLFNADTVDKVLARLMTHGQHVAGGERLGKTIIFAKNQAHAEFIRQRFDHAYPNHRGVFAQVISHAVRESGSLIEQFGLPDRPPHIAISVDMLDTGIDVPEVVNLIFFKLVRSRVKFWQMIGRGTRLRPDLFGPGLPKQNFTVFDYCQNLEFFSQNPPADEGVVAESLGARLFRTRLDMLGVLDARGASLGEPVGPPQGVLGGGDAQSDREQQERAKARPGFAEKVLRSEVADLLRSEVAAMNPDVNFLVRPHRRLIERFAAASAWEVVDEPARDDLARDVAGLPSERDPEREEAKRFDLLMLNLQLCVLDAAPGFERLRGRVMELASALEAQSSIPAIRAHGALLQDLQTDAWWEDVTAPMLETVRKRLRGVMHLIEKSRARIVYTDFADEEGVAVEVAFGAFENPGTFERFRDRARLFLRAHEDHVAVGKLRMNRALTPVDLEELERMLRESGVGSTEQVDRAKIDSAGLGLFVRSLVGLDRAAVQAEFAGFIQGRTLRPNQIEFLEMMIEHLQEHGVMEASRLYEPPYTDLNERGLDGLFNGGDAECIVDIVNGIHRRAAA